MNNVAQAFPFMGTANPINTNTNLANKNRILSNFISKFINTDFIEDVVNVSMFQIDVSNMHGKNIDTIVHIKNFIIECQKDLDKLKNINLNNLPIPLLKNSLQFARRVLELKTEVGIRLLTYDNLEDHFSTINDIHIKKMIQTIKENRIQTIDEFKKKLDVVLQTVQVGGEIRNIRQTLIAWDSLLENSENDSLPLLNLASEYRNLLIESYGKLSELKIVNKVSELSDYILIDDLDSCSRIANDVTKYLATGYSFYKSGYSILDDNIGGIESSNVHLICGPSNNAKSIFLINLAWQMILNNVRQFQPGDQFIYYTLEDDIYKLIRRFISIFGNVNSNEVKKLFIKASELLQQYGVMNSPQKNNHPLYISVLKTVEELLTESIYSVTGKRIQFILKHCRESTSPADIMRFIDARRCEGGKVRALFIDYIDIMVPSSVRYTSFNDYDNHGSILIELRNMGMEYSIPIITITQATRATENSAMMSNEQVARILALYIVICIEK